MPFRFIKYVTESFFCKFYCRISKAGMGKNTLLLYVEVPERATLEDCLYRLYTRNIRNVVVWQDDQTVDREKLLRLRSIGMNMVFFDADDALPYADAVFLDNADAVKSLLKSVEFPGENYLYVGWDNRSISNVRKKGKLQFTENCPDGSVVRIPWRRDRKIDEESVKRVKEQIQKVPQGMIVCWGQVRLHSGYQNPYGRQRIRSKKYVIGTIDDFDGSDRYPVKVCVQNLRESARKIYQRLEEQSELGSGWKAESYLIRGKIIK